MAFPLPIPTTIGSAIGFFIEAIIAFAAISIADLIIAHEIEPKRSFVMAILAYFIVPVVSFFLTPYLTSLIPAVIVFYLIPLIVWLILGEILLEEDAETKLKVAAVAYIVYLVLTFLGVPAIISSFIPI